MTLLESFPPSASVDAGTRWTDVCDATHLVAGRGVCALVDDHQVAVFLTEDGSTWGMGNIDPYSGAAVLSRGMTGSIEHEGALVPFVASPVFKQRFDLRTGKSLEDPATGVAVWAVRVEDGIVQVGHRDYGETAA